MKPIFISMWQRHVTVFDIRNYNTIYKIVMWSLGIICNHSFVPFDLIHHVFPVAEKKTRCNLCSFKC